MHPLSLAHTAGPPAGPRVESAQTLDSEEERVDPLLLCLLVKLDAAQALGAEALLASARDGALLLRLLPALPPRGLGHARAAYISLYGGGAAPRLGGGDNQLLLSFDAREVLRDQRLVRVRVWVWV